MFLYLYLISALLLVVTAFVIFRVLVRRDYRQKGRLTPFTAFLELLIWGMVVCFPTIYNPADWWYYWSAATPVFPIVRIIGIAFTTVGIIIMAAGIGMLGIPKTFGRNVTALKQTGLYSFSRNPQIIGFGLMVIGVVVLWPSWYALGWLVIVGVIAHMMVMTEEEHLRKLFGEEYERYCEQVPRYFRVRGEEGGILEEET